MNLEQIVVAIQRELQYAPDVREHRQDIRRKVQAQHLELIGDRRWPFLERQASLPIFPDFELTTVQCELGTNRRRMLFFGATHLQDVMYPADEVDSYALLIPRLEGATVELADPDLRSDGDGNWSRAPFTIERVDLSGYPTVTIWLDQRADLLTFTGDEGNLAFRFPRYQLPVDCRDLISITDDTGAVLRPIDHHQYRVLSATGPQTALRPRHVVEDLGNLARLPTLHANYDAWSGTEHARTDLEQQLRNADVRTTITAAASAGVGLTSGSVYQFFVSWMYAGRFGPPSNTVEVTPSGGNLQVTLGNLPQVPTSLSDPPNSDTGWMLAIFVSQDDGAFYLGEVIDPKTPAAGNSHVFTSPLRTREPWSWVRADAQLPPTYRYVRLWPKPTEFQLLTLRYWGRTRGLVEDDDVPEIDEDLHEYLVFATAARIGARSTTDGFADRMNALAAQYLERIYMRHLPGERHRTVQKGQIGRYRSRRPPFVGPINWQGD